MVIKVFLILIEIVNSSFYLCSIDYFIDISKGFFRYFI